MTLLGQFQASFFLRKNFERSKTRHKQKPSNNKGNNFSRAQKLVRGF